MHNYTQVTLSQTLTIFNALTNNKQYICNWSNWKSMLAQVL